MKTPTILLAVLSLCMPVLLVAKDEPPGLAHNPFSRPPSDVILEDRRTVGLENSVNPDLELRATLIGSVNRLANVGGRILKRGDEVQGYVLVAIHEQYAVFRRNGNNRTVYVKPLQAEDDE